MSELFSGWILPCCWAFLACIGFCLIFNIHGPGILICGGGGALGWLVYLLSAFMTDGPVLRCLIAAIAVTLYSELMARVRKCPVTSYLLIALLPFVPGSGIYAAMRHCVQGDITAFLSDLQHTFGIAGALAVGVLVGSSLTRLILPIVWFLVRRCRQRAGA